MHLKKVQRDGWLEVVDTRTGEVVCRSPQSPEELQRSADRYVASVAARAERLAQQDLLNQRLIAKMWNQPMTY